MSENQPFQFRPIYPSSSGSSSSAPTNDARLTGTELWRSSLANLPAGIAVVPSMAADDRAADVSANPSTRKRGRPKSSAATSVDSVSPPKKRGRPSGGKKSSAVPANSSKAAATATAASSKKFATAQAPTITEATSASAVSCGSAVSSQNLTGTHTSTRLGPAEEASSQIRGRAGSPVAKKSASQEKAETAAPPAEKERSKEASGPAKKAKKVTMVKSDGSKEGKTSRTGGQSARRKIRLQERELPSTLTALVQSSEAAVGCKLEAAALGSNNLRQVAREAAVLLHSRYKVQDEATLSVALTFMAPDVGILGQGSLAFRMGMAVTGIVRSLWGFRDLLLVEGPCTDVELASLVATVNTISVEGKIALLAWMLIVASWMSRRGLPGVEISHHTDQEMEEEGRQEKLLQLMALASAIIKRDKSGPKQRKQLTKIFKDLKKLIRG